MRRHLQRIIPPLIIGLIMLHCHVDHGLAPLPASLSVRVIFRNTPPENTQGIYLTVSPTFPPHAINEMHHLPNSLPIDRDTVETEMALPYGHYDAVALWWYSKETESNFADVLGLPLDVNNNLLPMGFELTPESPHRHMDLYANWERVSRDASVSGSIFFNGPFPENTLATAVAAYQYAPESDVHYLLWLKSMDFSVGPASLNYHAAANRYDFHLPIRHGRVNYIAVFWLPEQAGLTDFQVLGVYEQPLSVAAGEHRTGIDIEADWSARGAQ